MDIGHAFHTPPPPYESLPQVEAVATASPRGDGRGSQVTPLFHLVNSVTVQPTAGSPSVHNSDLRCGPRLQSHTDPEAQECMGTGPLGPRHSGTLTAKSQLLLALYQLQAPQEALQEEERDLQQRLQHVQERRRSMAREAQQLQLHLCEGATVAAADGPGPGAEVPPVTAPVCLGPATPPTVEPTDAAQMTSSTSTPGGGLAREKNGTDAPLPILQQRVSVGEMITALWYNMGTSEGNTGTASHSLLPLPLPCSCYSCAYSSLLGSLHTLTSLVSSAPQAPRSFAGPCGVSTDAVMEAYLRELVRETGELLSYDAVTSTSHGNTVRTSRPVLRLLHREGVAPLAVCVTVLTALPISMFRDVVSAIAFPTETQRYRLVLTYAMEFARRFVGWAEAEAGAVSHEEIESDFPAMIAALLQLVDFSRLPDDVVADEQQRLRETLAELHATSWPGCLSRNASAHNGGGSAPHRPLSPPHQQHFYHDAYGYCSHDIDTTHPYSPSPAPPPIPTTDQELTEEKAAAHFDHVYQAVLQALDRTRRPLATPVGDSIVHRCDGYQRAASDRRVVGLWDGASQARDAGGLAHPLCLPPEERSTTAALPPQHRIRTRPANSPWSAAQAMGETDVLKWW